MTSDTRMRNEMIDVFRWAVPRPPSDLRQRRLRLRHQPRKPRRIIHCQVRENLAVEFDSGLLQAVDELVVAQPVQLGGGADAHNPQRADLPLALLASGIGKLQPALDRLLRRAVKLRFCQEITACAVKYLLAFLAAFGSALYTRHGALLFAFFLWRLEVRTIRLGSDRWPLHTPGT